MYIRYSSKLTNNHKTITMKNAKKSFLYFLIILSASLYSCKKEANPTDPQNNKYTVSYNYAGVYNNEVSQIVETDNFALAFFSVMEMDSIRVRAFVYKDKANNTSLLYHQNLTRDTAFVFELVNNEPTNNGLRFHNKNDSLIMESIDYNKTNNTYYVLQKYNLGKLNFTKKNTSALRTSGTLGTIEDLQKQLNETLKYFGRTPVGSWIADNVDELTNSVNQLANQLSNSLKEFKKYLLDNAQQTIKDAQAALAQYQKEQEEIKKQKQETDCIGIVNGTAKVDDCGICSGGTSGHVANSNKDCAGVCNGSAFLDGCEICSGGTSGHAPNIDKDCAGVCYGSAFIDSCGVCAAGNTGIIPCNERNTPQTITIDRVWQESCTSSTAVKSYFFVSFTASGPGIIVGGGSGACDITSTTDQCYPCRLYFKDYLGEVNNSSNAYDVSLYSGTPNNGVLKYELYYLGSNYSNCQSVDYPNPYSRDYGVRPAWQVELMNICNTRTKSAWFDIIVYGQ